MKHVELMKQIVEKQWVFDITLRLLALFLVMLVLSPGLLAQQIADTTYNPPISHPAYASGEGPVVFIDEGHYNFHTKEGRYTSFASLLERDGYEVQAFQGEFKPKKLVKGKILVISNALHEQNVENWFLPTYSAFTPKEINAITQWVVEGGRLFLIADHMPLAGAAKDLAKAFGFEFTDGFVMNPNVRGAALFNVNVVKLTHKTIIPRKSSCLIC